MRRDWRSRLASAGRRSVLVGAQREERGNPVKVALLAIAKDLLVAGLDPHEADWPAFVLLLQPTGEQWSVELEGVHGAERVPPVGNAIS